MLVRRFFFIGLLELFDFFVFELIFIGFLVVLSEEFFNYEERVWIVIKLFLNL